MPNAYYSPERLDLEVIGDLEMSEPDYSFDTVVVWRHIPTGDLYWAQDAGCSCPTPFEDYNSLEQLTKLVSANLDEFAREISRCYQPEEARSLLRKVRKTMRG